MGSKPPAVWPGEPTGSDLARGPLWGRGNASAEREPIVCGVLRKHSASALRPVQFPVFPLLRWEYGGSRGEVTHPEVHS